jgi:hypothetical protein
LAFFVSRRRRISSWPRGESSRSCSPRPPLTAAIVAAQHTFRQNRWAQYEHEMQDPIDDPPDAWEQTEFAFARLRFRSPRDGYFRRFARWGTDSTSRSASS